MHSNCVHILTYHVLLLLGFHVAIANFVSIVVETPVSFALKRRYVFKPDDDETVMAQFVKFVLSRCFSFFVEFFGVLILCLITDKYTAKIIGQIMVFFVNYIVSDKFVFRKIGTRASS